MDGSTPHFATFCTFVCDSQLWMNHTLDDTNSPLSTYVLEPLGNMVMPKDVFGDLIRLIFTFEKNSLNNTLTHWKITLM